MGQMNLIELLDKPEVLHLGVTFFNSDHSQVGLDLADLYG